MSDAVVPNIVVLLLEVKGFLTVDNLTDEDGGADVGITIVVRSLVWSEVIFDVEWKVDGCLVDGLNVVGSLNIVVNAVVPIFVEGFGKMEENICVVDFFVVAS